MPTVHFTSHLEGRAPSGPVEVEGTTVAEALQAALEGNDLLRSYLMDEQGRVRRHIALFVDGKIVVDRLELADPVQPDSEVYVMQALSGG